jgi:hypothetical protein
VGLSGLMMMIIIMLFSYDYPNNVGATMSAPLTCITA